MKAAARRGDAPRVHPAVAPLAALAASAAGAVYLWGTDPHQPGQLLPRCPVNWATGLLCPACGGTRMAYDLLHGDVAAAFADNAVLLVLGVPLAAWLGGRWLVEGLRGRRYRPAIGTRGVGAILGIALVWVLVRNLSG
ncbi:DUF2752 domain-containing protein [Streptomyces sp. 549]|uniref:DUF2752 domain-containing protein n=1 Tax=Streptomyces sp. 549 TaxID=3049076 RepID=UPI0024C3D0CC|nr:DUF2752 domain-containing protein [Streptomyces sp. 549]MDK1476327.1 DUF2752 domain-containing protein [Streptomyces sp. 549]